MSVRTSCPACGGYGIIHDEDNEEVQCPKCNGSGFIYIKDENEEWTAPDTLPSDK